MSRLQVGGQFIRKPIDIPIELFLITEAALARSLTAVERGQLAEMFENTIHAYDFFAASPRAVQTRKLLLKIGRTGKLPNCYAAGAAESRRRSLSLLEILVAAGLSDEEIICRWVEEFPEEAKKIAWHQDPEQLEAVRRITTALEVRGYDVASAPPMAIREEARRATAEVRLSTRKGRESGSFGQDILWWWADLGEELGFNPSAAHSSSKNKRDTPFLRWISALAGIMPESAKTPMLRGLGERLRKTLRVRSQTDVRNNFK